MYIADAMYDNDISSKLYHHLSELEEKLLKSEAERKTLEAKFQYLAETYKNEEERKLTHLKQKYSEFLDGCKERNRRNGDILKSLQKVENGANAVFAKTERLKQLRSHYDAYLSRAIPLWRHPDVLQLQGARPEPGKSSPWIREPRFVRPALLLPGGGAVMLPVDETGRNISAGSMFPMPEKQPMWAPHQVPSQIIKPSLGESFVSSVDPSFFTLGEAGQRMMQELRITDRPTVSGLAQVSAPEPPRPAVYYQPYHLPVYIPPTYGPTDYCATASLNSRIGTSVPVPQDVDVFYQGTNRTEYDARDRKKNWYWKEDVEVPATYSPGRASISSNYKLSQKIDDAKANTGSSRVAVAGDYVRDNPSSSRLVHEPPAELVYPQKSRIEKGRDDFEIDCLSADGNYVDEDPNLSDDEVLDVAMARSHSPYRDDSPVHARHETGRESAGPVAGPVRGRNAPTVDSRNYVPRTIAPNAASYDDQDSSLYKKSPQARPTTAHPEPLEAASPVAKKIVVAHQKSIEELKAMLSFEEDSAPLDNVNGHHTCQELPPQGQDEEIEFLVDEDVPDDFTEQNYPDSQYDPRFQRDVSRNVILEEDEEDEVVDVPVNRSHSPYREETSPKYPPNAGRKPEIGVDWRRLQSYRQQGKLTSANLLDENNRRGSMVEPQEQTERNVPRRSDSNGFYQEPLKSPQHYAQQLKTINGSPNHSVVPREPPRAVEDASRYEVSKSLSRSPSGEMRELRPVTPQQQQQRQNVADFQDTRQASGGELTAFGQPAQYSPERQPVDVNQHDVMKQNFEGSRMRPQLEDGFQKTTADNSSPYRDPRADARMGNNQEHYSPPETQLNDGSYPYQQPSHHQQQVEKGPEGPSTTQVPGENPSYEEFGNYGQVQDEYGHAPEGESNYPVQNQYGEYRETPQNDDEYYRNQEPQAEYAPDPNSVEQYGNQTPSQGDYRRAPEQNYNRYEGEVYDPNNEFYQEGNQGEPDQSQYRDFPGDGQPVDYQQDPNQYQYSEAGPPEGHQEPYTDDPRMYQQSGHPDEYAEDRRGHQYQPNQPSYPEEQQYQQTGLQPGGKDAAPYSEPYSEPAYEYEQQPREDASTAAGLADTAAVAKPSVLNQLMDSESESYKVEPAGSAHDDSDFDFSIGKQ